jgi:hypothetical protein
LLIIKAPLYATRGEVKFDMTPYLAGLYFLWSLYRFFYRREIIYVTCDQRRFQYFLQLLAVKFGANCINDREIVSDRSALLFYQCSEANR